MGEDMQSLIVSEKGVNIHRRKEWITLTWYEKHPQAG
jgi:hypothetical protein